MKFRKNQNRDQRNTLNDQVSDNIHNRKKKNKKVKYKHKNYWLEEDDNYDLPIFKYEEE